MADTTNGDALALRRVQSKPARAEGQHVPTFTVSELERLSFTVEMNPKGDSIVYGASGLPRHATFDPVERLFTWRPRPGEDGTWAITFTATEPDGNVSTMIVRIKVRALQNSLPGNPRRISL